jgi:limonene-1,2-epoxide hydrolase
MPESAMEIASAFVKAINQEDLTALRAVMTEDHTFTDAQGRSFSGAEKMIAGWKHFFDAYPRYWIRVSAAFVDGARVALFGEAGGKWKVEDRVLPESWSVTAAWLAEVEGGKVKKWSVYCDTGWATPPAQTAQAPAEEQK